MELAPSKVDFHEKPRRLHIRPGERMFAFGLVAPAVLITVFVVFIPLLYALYLSFNTAEILVVGGRGGIVTEWVGLKNFNYFIQDSAFWKGVRVTAYFTVVSLVLELVLGIAIAEVLNQKFVGRSLVRALLILPWAIPTVVNARLWGLIFEPQGYGALNGFLLSIGWLRSGEVINFLTPIPLFKDVPLVGSVANWLGATSAITWIIVGDTWKVLPVVTLLLLAGLQSIPLDLYEAAQVDGASAWYRFWRITLPLLRPMLLVILVYRTMELFRVFDILYILMAYTIPVVAIRTFQEAFVFGLFGRGSAIAFLIGLIILIVAIGYIRLILVEDNV